MAMTVDERIRNIFVDLHGGILTNGDGRIKDDALRSLLELEMHAVRHDAFMQAAEIVRRHGIPGHSVVQPVIASACLAVEAEAHK